MAGPPPAAISEAARAALARAAAAPHPDIENRPIAEVRAGVRAAYAPAAEAAIAASGVMIEETSLNGIAATSVTPPDVLDGRTILYIFGGGFTLGSAFEDMPIITALATGTKARVIAPHYRLAPEHPFPAALDDVDCVAGALAAAGTDYVLSGESAGGNLALGLTHRLRRQGRPVPRALALMSPAVDISEEGDSKDADRDPFLPAFRLPQVARAYLGTHDPTDPEASPVYGSFDAGFPATMVTTGSRDLLLSDGLRLARVMRECGASIDLRVWEGMWHVFEFYPEIPEARASLAELSAFIVAAFDGADA